MKMEEEEEEGWKGRREKDGKEEGRRKKGEGRRRSGPGRQNVLK